MSTHHELPAVSCKDLREMQASGAPHRIIDVRDLTDYEVGHIDGSVHVPHDELEKNIDALVPEKSHTIVVVVGEEPEHAKTVHGHLTARGYGDVRFLLGGFDAWCKPAEPDIQDLVEEAKEEKEIAENRHGHGEDIDDVEQGTQDEPFM
jgi:rhodanese-related sulfurtransferase